MTLLIIGLAAGVISGMGVGGGTLLIPGMTLLAGMSQHTAQAINLAIFLPSSAVALWIHIKGKRVQGNVLVWIIPLGLITAALGAWVAAWTGQDTLRKIFGGFLLILALWEWFSCKKKGKGKAV